MSRKLFELTRGAIKTALDFHQPINDDKNTLSSIREMIIGQLASDCEQGLLDYKTISKYPRILVDIKPRHGMKLDFTVHMQHEHTVISHVLRYEEII